MGGAVSAGRDNDELIDNLVEADYIQTPIVQEIFRAVDRGDYYSDTHKKHAYRDMAWRLGNLHLSAPCVYSEVMESLKLKSGLSFLNLGSGSGYLSTMAGLILGPYGINHGVEIYKDVVDFAYDKLEEFTKHSQAVDEYEFCEPAFIVGNCLRLENNSPQYDRVYCGAACPEEHENYVKHLVKIGGILVMPLNDKLLQITRTGESTWETAKVLSVSFAPLISPPTEDSSAPVKLPDFSPPSLQELCRAKVRSIFRSSIDKDYPNLKGKRKGSSRNKNRRQVRRIVIPIFDESDNASNHSRSISDEEDSHDSDSGPEYTIGPRIPSRMSALLENFMRRSAEIQELVTTSNNRHNDREGETSNSNLNAKQEGSSKAPEKESDDSGEDTEMDIDEDKVKNTDTELVCSHSFIDLSEKKQDKNIPKASKPQAKTLRKRKYMETGPSTSAGSSSQPKHKIKRRTATVIWKRIAPGETYSDSDKEEKTENGDNDESDKENENYTSLMVKMIQSLPLPGPLQKYVNYRRNNL